MRFENIQHVDASLERTFEVFADIQRHAEYVDEIIGVEVLSSSAFGLGSRYRVRYKDYFESGPATEWSICEFNKPSGFSSEGETAGLSLRCDYHFEPEGEGTRVRLISETRETTLMGRVMRVVIKLLPKDMFIDLKDKQQQVLIDLAKACE